MKIYHATLSMMDDEPTAIDHNTHLEHSVEFVLKSESDAALAIKDAQLAYSREEFEQMSWDYQHLKHKGKTEEFIKEEQEKDLNSFDFHVRKAGIAALEGDKT